MAKPGATLCMTLPAAHLREARLLGWACEIRSAPGDRQGVGGASPLR